jgi:hypothetical protein
MPYGVIGLSYLNSSLSQPRCNAPRFHTAMPTPQWTSVHFTGTLELRGLQPRSAASATPTTLRRRHLAAGYWRDAAATMCDTDDDKNPARLKQLAARVLHQWNLWRRRLPSVLPPLPVPEFIS